MPYVGFEPRTSRTLDRQRTDLLRHERIMTTTSRRDYIFNKSLQPADFEVNSTVLTGKGFSELCLFEPPSPSHSPSSILAQCKDFDAAQLLRDIPRQTAATCSFCNGAASPPASSTRRTALTLPLSLSLSLSRSLRCECYVTGCTIAASPPTPPPTGDVRPVVLLDQLNGNTLRVAPDQRMNKVTRPMEMLILSKAEGYTTCTQVDIEQGFQKCSFCSEQPLGNGAAVAQWLGRSPSTMAIRVRSPAGSLPDFRTWVSCWKMPLAGGLSRGAPVSPRPFIPTPRHPRVSFHVMSRDDGHLRVPARNNQSMDGHSRGTREEEGMLTSPCVGVGGGVGEGMFVVESSLAPSPPPPTTEKESRCGLTAMGQPRARLCATQSLRQLKWDSFAVLLQCRHHAEFNVTLCMHSPHFAQACCDVTPAERRSRIPQRYASAFRGTIAIDYRNTHCARLPSAPCREFLSNYWPEACNPYIHGDSSPLLLQPFHELSNGFWQHLTSHHRRSNSFRRCSKGLRSGFWAGQSNRRTLLSASQGPMVAERSARSAPTKANGAQSPAGPDFSQVGIVPDDAVGRRVFSGISRLPRPFIPAPLHIHFNNPHRLSRHCDGNTDSLTNSQCDKRTDNLPRRGWGVKPGPSPPPPPVNKSATLPLSYGGSYRGPIFIELLRATETRAPALSSRAILPPTAFLYQTFSGDPVILRPASHPTRPAALVANSRHPEHCFLHSSPPGGTYKCVVALAVTSARVRRGHSKYIAQRSQQVHVSFTCVTGAASHPTRPAALVANSRHSEHCFLHSSPPGGTYKRVVALAVTSARVRRVIRHVLQHSSPIVDIQNTVFSIRRRQEEHINVL
ncbi:hypothetical protein PR048_007275 [Dryococelus australis]|uniref:Uncharacterized protein n=1 Tax=Dryococelus australis TaxID=614101 RepID=A0ABQ9ID70_9NEOP|nr:hypothetical protein PR048_007275 [Dryococelus australis]